MVKNWKVWSAYSKFRGKTSCIACRHNNSSQVFMAYVEALAMSLLQNNGKMAERHRCQVINIWQNFKAKAIRYIQLETAAIFFLVNLYLKQGIG